MTLQEFIDQKIAHLQSLEENRPIEVIRVVKYPPLPEGQCQSAKLTLGSFSAQFSTVETLMKSPDVCSVWHNPKASAGTFKLQVDYTLPHELSGGRTSVDAHETEEASTDEGTETEPTDDGDGEADTEPNPEGNTEEKGNAGSE